VCRLPHKYRGVTTRYEKFALNYLGVLKPAMKRYLRLLSPLLSYQLPDSQAQPKH